MILFMVERSLNRLEEGRIRQSVIAFAFLSYRGDIIEGGNDTTVYKRRNTDFVVKELIRDDAISGYVIAMQLLGEEQMARTFFIEDLGINVNLRRRTIKRALIQEKVRPLEDELVELIKSKKVDTIKELIEKKVFLDKEILRRGVFIQDPDLKNHGIRENGEVVLIDPGRAVIDPREGEPGMHLARLINRGWTHYSIYMRLQDWGEHQLRGVLKYPHELSDLYKEKTGYAFDPKINASTHLRLATTSFQNLALFTGRPYLDLAQKELDKFFPRPVPINLDDPDVKALGSGHLDEWEILRDGRLVRKMV